MATDIPDNPGASSSGEPSTVGAGVVTTSAVPTAVQVSPATTAKSASPVVVERCASTDIRLRNWPVAKATPLPRTPSPTATAFDHRGSRVPTLPPRRVPHMNVPGGNTTTVYACNLPFNVGELELVNLFCSVNGVYDSRSTAVSAVNFTVRRDRDGNPRLGGQCFILYASSELARFAVDRLDNLLVRSRRISVMISRERLSCRRSTGNLLVGQSRMGEDISNCSL